MSARSSVVSGMATPGTPRRVTRASSREAAAVGAPANVPVPNTPASGRRGKQADDNAAVRPPVPTKASNAYGAAGTPNMAQQLAEADPVNAVQAIATGVSIAVKTAGGPHLPGIAEEGDGDDGDDGDDNGDENDGDGDGDEAGQPAGGNGGPIKNVPATNVPGNTTGNTNTFNDPSHVLDEVAVRLQQHTGGARRPVTPVVRQEAPPGWTVNYFKLLLAFLLAGLSWWFWTFGSTITPQSGIGSPYGLGQQLAERLGFGRIVGVGSAAGNPPAAHEYSHLLQRINNLERRLDVTPAQQAGSQVRQVNYFAIGAGAIIEPYITSPTKTTHRPFAQRLRAWSLGLYYPEGFGPLAALGPWDDMGDCWCAPPPDHLHAGRAQLGVLLPRKIFPTELVIEHIPASATFDIHSAPKEIELWGLIEDDTARDAVGNAIFPLLPDDSTAVNPRDKAWKYVDPMRMLDYRYIRLGKWKYDIHSANNIQTFQVPVDLQHFDAVVNKVVVRSLNNWGYTTYTCFYRLKLHGELAFPEEVREEDKHESSQLAWWERMADWFVDLYYEFV